MDIKDKEIKLSFNKGNPPKDGRYICLVENTGTGFSYESSLEIPMTEQYICCGNWIFNRWFLDDATSCFRFHNGKDEVIGWCGFEY